MTLADIVLIEADGAKRMPCKAPAAHEPVLLPQCDTVLAVAGLSALRHPLRERSVSGQNLPQSCFCVPQDAQLTPELLAKLLASVKPVEGRLVGERSFYAVLNQVDTKEQAALARQVADILKKIYQRFLRYVSFRKRRACMSKEEKIVFCTGGGCTAKLGAGALSRILEKLPRGAKDPNLLVGLRQPG